MNPGEKLLLLAHPRSGSSNLHEILQLHPELEICNEPFNEDRTSWGLQYTNYCERVHDWASLETVLDEIFVTCNGLKLLSYQLPEEWVIRLIGRPDFRVIFVRRRNVLQAVVSVLIAEQTQLWHRWDTSHPIESYYAELEPLDVADVRARVHGLAGELQRLEKAIERQGDGRTRSLVYEDLFFADPAEQIRAMRALWSFLGLNPVSSDRIDYFLRPERSKLNSPATYRLLPNADEIERECGFDATGHLLPAA
jgi:LPS sulfotransferase NodH